VTQVKLHRFLQQYLTFFSCLMIFYSFIILKVQLPAMKIYMNKSHVMAVHESCKFDSVYFINIVRSTLQTYVDVVLLETFHFSLDNRSQYKLIHFPGIKNNNYTIFWGKCFIYYMSFYFTLNSETLIRLN
jgi:hypothetical protein